MPTLSGFTAPGILGQVGWDRAVSGEGMGLAAPAEGEGHFPRGTYLEELLCALHPRSIKELSGARHSQVETQTGSWMERAQKGRVKCPVPLGTLPPLQTPYLVATTPSVCSASPECRPF